ncbi:MAG: LL-diaminopimelate aminotransferase [Chlamydiae bacterium]|nr:LL-diaminopimelate aminotransferase [Chlamydiota bacterium]
MVTLKKGILQLSQDYLFKEIEKHISLKNIKNEEILRLGIGDITLPQSNITFNDIFISDGIKCDIANIQHLFEENNVVAISSPAYPVYADVNTIYGRKENLIYIPCLEENNFQPIPPKEHADFVYLCSPNNPTGVALTKETLELWVAYAKKEKAIIYFDGAYVAFIRSKNIPVSIYEIEGADEVAIEMRSFSKTAGFTGLRCSYIAIPSKLVVQDKNESYPFKTVWQRYINSTTGGISYPIQKAAAHTFSPQGQIELKKNLQIYQKSTTLLKEGLQKAGFTVFGGIDSPYVWCKTLNKMNSWDFFDYLLEKARIVTTPGSGFGPFGEEFVRFSGFASEDTVKKALNRLKDIA